MIPTRLRRVPGWMAPGRHLDEHRTGTGVDGTWTGTGTRMDDGAVLGGLTPHRSPFWGRYLFFLPADRPRPEARRANPGRVEPSSSGTGCPIFFFISWMRSRSYAARLKSSCSAACSMSPSSSRMNSCVTNRDSAETPGSHRCMAPDVSETRASTVSCGSLQER